MPPQSSKKITSPEQNKKKNNFGLLVYEKVGLFVKSQSNILIKKKSKDLLTENIKIGNAQLSKLNELKSRSDKTIGDIQKQISKVKIRNQAKIKSLLTEMTK